MKRNNLSSTSGMRRRCVVHASWQCRDNYFFLVICFYTIHSSKMGSVIGYLSLVGPTGERFISRNKLYVQEFLLVLGVDPTLWTFFLAIGRRDPAKFLNIFIAHHSTMQRHQVSRYFPIQKSLFSN